MKSFKLVGAAVLAALALAGCGGFGHSRPPGGTEDISLPMLPDVVHSQEFNQPENPTDMKVPPAARPNRPEPASLSPNAKGGAAAAPERKKEETAPVLKEPAAAPVQQSASSPAAAKKEKEKPGKPPKKTEKSSVPVQQNRISHKSLTLSQIREKYGTFFKVSGSSAEKKIALTFDDGPDDNYTAQVLDMLKKYHVKATFFVLGSRAEQHPELVKRMAREGHVVGNHTYSHANLPKLSAPNFEKQVERTQSVLKAMIGYEPKLFRPPYGAVNEEQAQWAADHQLMIVNWNVDSLDWKGFSAAKVESIILSTTKPGSIILQHCGGGPGEDLSGTVQALPGIIQKLKNQGYQFVTVSELLHVPKGK